MKIRASSLSDLFDCPARWEARYITKVPPLPSSGSARLGTAVHAGTALFDQSRIVNAGLTIDDTAGAVVDSIWDNTEDTDWSETPQKEAEKIAIALHEKYCREISPAFDYVEVEAECDALIISDLDITLTGTTDRIYQDAMTGEFGIADIKTGKTAVTAQGEVKTASHAAQIAVYELLAEQATGRPINADAKIIGLATAKTAAAQRAGIGSISGAKEVLLGSDTHKGLLEMASAMLKTGIFYGNPRSSLCSPKYCPNYQICKFRR